MKKVIIIKPSDISTKSGATGKYDKELFPSERPGLDDERAASTFCDDFTMAEASGAAEVSSVFESAFKKWQGDYRRLTELAVVTNRRCWLWNENDGTLCALYGELYAKVRDWCYEHLNDEELRHYLRVAA